MHTKDLILHCYAIKEDNQWGAFCLDLTLAAQGDSFEEAKRKLHSMIREYVYDAVKGDDKEHCDQLLNRSAPWAEWIKYYLLNFCYKIHLIKDNFYKLFNEPMPLILPATSK